jgi:hypothetical protein
MGETGDVVHHLTQQIMLYRDVSAVRAIMIGALVFAGLTFAVVLSWWKRA